MASVLLAPTRRRQQTFTASGTWTVPPGVELVDVLVVGGGGGGGQANQNSTPGCGGGGGQVIRRRVAVTPGAAVPVTVGAGGPGGPANSGSNGTDGGASSFGTLTARGGTRGAGNGSPNSGVVTGEANTVYGMSGDGFVPLTSNPGSVTYNCFAGAGAGGDAQAMTLGNSYYGTRGAGIDGYGEGGKHHQPPTTLPANTGHGGHGNQPFSTLAASAGASGVVIIEWEG